jgi:hypothetical protein
MATCVVVQIKVSIIEVFKERLHVLSEILNLPYFKESFFLLFYHSLAAYVLFIYILSEGVPSREDTFLS